jgi:hypothetical protein
MTMSPTQLGQNTAIFIPLSALRLPAQPQYGEGLDAVNHSVSHRRRNRHGKMGRADLSLIHRPQLGDDLRRGYSG